MFTSLCIDAMTLNEIQGFCFNHNPKTEKKQIEQALRVVINAQLRLETVICLQHLNVKRHQMILLIS